MSFVLYTSLYSLSLFFGLLLGVKIGHVLGRRKHALEDDVDASGISALDGAVFGLLGLLLAFSFSGAISRYDSHRDLLTQEASDIGGAYAKLDLLPSKDQPALRTLLREYTKSRIDAYQAALDSPAEQAANGRSLQLQEQIWKQGIDAAKGSGNPAVLTQVSNSLDSVFDAPTKQLAARRSLPPRVIYILIFVLALMSAVLLGFELAAYPTLPTIHVVLFAAAVAITMYVILDLQHPRLGFFNPDPTNRLLVETLEGMH